ncbi:hypothetical protein ACFX2I_009590 [Malus domestica]
MNLLSYNPFLGYFKLAAQGNIGNVDVGLDEKAADALVLEEAVAEATRQGDGSSHVAGDAKDLSKLFGDYEGEAEPIVETRATCWTRATVVESSKSEPEDRSQPQLSIPGSRTTLTKKRTNAQTSRAPKSSKSSTAPPVEAGRKKQKSSRPQATKKLTFVSMEELLGAEMHQMDNKLLDSIFEELQDTREEMIFQPEVSSPPA